MVLRTITTQIPNFDELKLPPVLKDVSLTKRGLVILVGGTVRASLLARRHDRLPQREQPWNIITIEDPVEYVHKNKNCLITHREVGTDTNTWHAALKNTCARRRT